MCNRQYMIGGLCDFLCGVKIIVMLANLLIPVLVSVICSTTYTFLTDLISLENLNESHNSVVKIATEIYKQFIKGAKHDLKNVFRSQSGFVIFVSKKVVSEIRKTELKAVENHCGSSSPVSTVASRGVVHLFFFRSFSPKTLR